MSIQRITAMSAPFQHRTRIYAIEQLACGHEGQRGYPETIQTRIAQGVRRRCPQCAAPPEETTMNLLAQIEAELTRLGLDSLSGDGSLDAIPTDDPAYVALMGTQETTVFEGAGLLQALQACPEDATWDDVWQAILPHRADA